MKLSITKKYLLLHLFSYLYLYIIYKYRYKWLKKTEIFRPNIFLQISFSIFLLLTLLASSSEIICNVWIQNFRPLHSLQIGWTPVHTGYDQHFVRSLAHISIFHSFDNIFSLHSHCFKDIPHRAQLDSVY